jgi:phosphoglycolate phosphatase-like HAD superfamily hydrolase
MQGTIDDRLAELERRPDATAESFDPDPPAEERATEIARRGVGPTVALYCEARTGGTWVRFDEAEFERLEATLNRWLSLYAACYGTELSGTYGVREAAELLVDTHDAGAVAAVLTGVPER